MSEQVKREIVQHLAFLLFFLAGLGATDFFMNDAWRERQDTSPSARVTGNRPPKAKPPIVKPTSWRATGKAAERATEPQAGWSGDQQETTDETESLLAAARELERKRVAVIDRIMPAVVSVFGLERQGGGSGVIIHPSGLALTNHHVIAAAGAEGWGGLADGQLYRWELVGNDPGGDLALIQLLPNSPGTDFPFVTMGDSDLVQVGDWTLVLGNPFTLAEDYRPTVTYGIVSGVKRYQPGMQDTLLVYGNCIQVDTSINPGNSGGPLFDSQGRLIGINGRASFDFRERGRVNVGLGYAISVNQCRNFLPELLATKLIQHGTLDALFGDRDGKVICTAIYEDADIGELGLALGDELLDFEGMKIVSANQFTNLICTLPAGWPARLTVRKPDGQTRQIRMRLIGLPYPKMDAPPPKAAEKNKPGEPDSDGAPEENAPQDSPPSLEQQVEASRMALFRFMSQPPGKVQMPEKNQRQATWLLERWSQHMDRSLASGDVDSAVHSGREVCRIVEDWTMADGRAAKWEVAVDWEESRLEARLSGLHVMTDETAEAGVAATPGDWDWSELEQRGLEPMAFRWEKGQWFAGNPKVSGDAVEWKFVNEDLVWRSTIGMQLGLLVLSLRPDGWKDGSWMIDGADWVEPEMSVRMRMGESENAPFVWLSLDDWSAEPTSRLLKLGSDMNGRLGLGAVRCDEWRWDLPFAWPAKRRIVSGLFEDERVRIETRSVTWTDRVPTSD
jgi:S1-C subfamily serine protease